MQGRNDHWVKVCYAKTHLDGFRLESPSKTGRQMRASTTSSIKRSNSSFEQTCNRCGRVGHFVPECYAKTNTNGQYI